MDISRWRKHLKEHAKKWRASWPGSRRSSSALKHLFSPNTQFFVGGLIPTLGDAEGLACRGAAPPTVGPEFPIAGFAVVLPGAVLLFVLALALDIFELFALLDEEQPAQNAVAASSAQQAKVRRMFFS